MSQKQNTSEEELKDNQAEMNENIDAETPADQVEEQEEVKEPSLEDKLKESNEKFIRLYAEFENYKKRTSKERMDLFKTAGQEVIVSLLPVLDDFERASKELAKSSDKEGFKGVELIKNKLKEALKSKGLQEIKSKQGDKFDAEVHDAITQIPAPSNKLKGKIIDVVEKGYSLGDKIIRHPKVVVGN